MDKNTERFWRAQLETLKGPFPEIGEEPPIEETNIVPKYKPTEDFKETNGIDPESIGNFSKVTMDVYFFMNTEDNRYFMMQTQSMTDFGEMTLKKAAEMVAKKRKRK